MPDPILQPGVYVGEMPATPPAVQSVATSVTVFIGPTRRGAVNRPAQIRSFLDFERKFGGLKATLETGYAVLQYFLNGGRDAWVVRVAQNPGLAKLQAALKSLDQVDLFNLLVLPGVTAPAALELAAAYCVQRRAFLIAESPAGQSPTQMRQAAAPVTGAARRNAALYYPWLRIADPLHEGQPRLSAPGGSVAGVFARTDTNRGVGKAPAGIEATLSGVTALEYNLTDAENGLLNPIAVNCLRTFAGPRHVVWGSRTLAGDDNSGDEYKYVPVRRMALHLEESVRCGIAWAVFEPNAEPLWARLRLCIGSFLQEYFRQGAFQGRTPQEAYLVQCGPETTTAADVSAGVVNIVIGFAPLKPAEFVLLRFSQRAAPSTP